MNIHATLLSGTTRLPDTRNFLKVKREENSKLPTNREYNRDPCYIHYDRRFSRGVEPGSLARAAISETTRPPEQRPLMPWIFMKLYWSYNYRCRGSGGPGACSSKNPETFRARKAIAKSGTLRSITKLFFIHLFLYEQRFPSNKNSSAYISPFLDTDELKMAFEKRTQGACSSKDWKVFRPAKPFTNRESWICLKLLVGREPIFILRIRE